MGRKCKCKVCKAELNTDMAYRVGEIGKKPRYYCSEIEYKKEEAVRQTRIKLNELEREYLGDTYNTAICKEEKMWGGDFEKVISFIENNRSSFDRMNTIVFQSEYAKIRYFSAIIKNGINDYVYAKPQQEIKELKDFEFYENKHKSKPRKGLLDYE